VAQGSSNNADTVIPTSGVLASTSNMYAPPTNLTSLSPSALTNIGGSQAHLNMQPFLAVNFSIALQGIFPSQT